MKLFNNKLLFVLFFAVSFFVINEIVTYYLSFNITKKEYFKNDKQTFKNLLKAQATNVEILAEALSHDRTVIKAYKQNDPQMLLNHIKPIWENVKSKKLIYEIHFFKPPAISFADLSTLNTLPVDVSKIRTDITWVTTSFKSSKHTFVCRNYVGLRATEPIHDENGTILGGLSLGKKIDWLPQAMKSATKEDSFLIYKKEAVQTLVFRNYQHFMKDKQLVGEKYILADATTSLTPQKILDIDFNKNIQSFKLNDKEYMLFKFPIIDFNGNIIAYLFTMNDMHTFLQQFKTNFLKNFILVFITSFFVIFLIHKHNISLLRYITYLEKTTNRIQRREFDKISQEEAPKCRDNALLKLKSNIFQMSQELQKYYKNLLDENKEKSKEITKQHYTDSLTGLKNRNALFEDLEKDTDQTYIAMLNIHRFKEVNGAFGYKVGNTVLKELATTISHILDERFNLYRLASDEYVISTLKTNISEKIFEQNIQNIIQTVEQKTFDIILDDVNIELHISLYAGICFENTQQLEKVETALIQAKSLKKSYVIYSRNENIEQKHLQNIHIIHDVTKALAEDRIVPFFQPIVDKEKNINKYEALVRIKQDDKILSPGYFLEVTQKTKYYKEITKCMIEKTFHTFKNSSLEFSINLTADDIIDDEIIQLIKEHLTQTKDRSRVVFELVETDDLSTLQEIEEFIKFIRSYDAKIAIDDFGSGYSNFSYIIKIKPDYLKIDGSLIKNIHQDKDSLQIVQTIVEFSKKLGIKTVAEFIHSEEVFTICKDIGINEFQGFYISEPKETITL